MWLMRVWLWISLTMMLPLLCLGAAPDLPGGTVAMTPTAAALAQTQGRLRFVATASGGDTLVLETEGLLPGYYLVAAETARQTFPLGQFLVADPTAGPEAVPGIDLDRANTAKQSKILSARTVVKLPNEVRWGRLKQIVVVNWAGTVILTANLATH